MGYRLKDVLAHRPAPVAIASSPRDTSARRRTAVQSPRSSGAQRHNGREVVPIVVRPAAPRRLTSGRYVLTGARERWNAERHERQARTLATLRETFAEGEQALVGWQAITLYLHGLGVRNAYGKAVTAAAIRRWRHRFDFPLLPGRWQNTAPFSTSYLILAWLVSLFRSGELDGITVTRGERDT